MVIYQNQEWQHLKNSIKSIILSLIDEGILLWFPGPESYTGEDMAEIHVHGSIAVLDQF